MRIVQFKVSLLMALALTATTMACGDDKKPAGSDAASDTTSDTVGPTDTQPLDTAPETVQGDTVAPDAAVDTALPDDLVSIDITPLDDTSPVDVADDVAADSTPDDAAGDIALDDGSNADVTPDDVAVDDTTASDVVTPTDVIADVGPDTVEPPDDNLFTDGSFERWDAGLPIGWYGSESNIGADNVAEDLTSPKEGLRACQLVNTSTKTHKRFTSAAQAFDAGRYTCTYWVRGTGDIRNARYNGDTDKYSNYTAFTSVSGDAWRELNYEFNLPITIASFELIFSVQNTSDAHLSIDDVRCVRAPEPCDAVTCGAWQVCDPTTVACKAAPGSCDDDLGCKAWQRCDEAHVCVLADDFCEKTIDCGGETPVCDLSSHLCVAGDPCEGVVCAEWEQCDPSDSACKVSPGRCDGLADCGGETPVCAKASHTCVAIDDPANVVPNGGFEHWSTFTLGTAEALLPDSWYGLQDAGPYFPATEIATTDVRYYEAAKQSGAASCQLVTTGAPAKRFTTEPFTVVASANYDCAYWVRGHGNFRHRAYCGGLGPDTEFIAYDSDEWQQVRFSMSGSSNRCVLIFYASNTVADRGHLQLDDVVCIRR